MSRTFDKMGAAPEARSAGFLLLLFGASAAPIFWLGQLMLGYAVTAYACYPGDHPVQVDYAPWLWRAMMAFDGVAVIAAAAGGAAAFWCWQRLRQEPAAANRNIRVGRARFLALWGLFSSLWFFFAILFNAIGSLTVPPCLT
jgi:hypothetical protein